MPRGNAAGAASASNAGPSRQDGKKAASTGHVRVGSAPSLTAQIRKQRSQTSEWTRVGIGTCAAAIGVVLLSTVFRPPRPEEHPQYLEALRTLQSDGLPPTDANIRFVLQLIDAATQPYSERGFRVVDPREWPPQCQASGICRQRPQVVEERRDLIDRNLTLLEVESRDAKVWVIEDFVSPEEGELLLRRASELNFTTSPTNHPDGQDWRSSSTAMAKKSDPAFSSLLRRATALFGVPVSFSEHPQIVRYLPGERYQPHMDSEGPDHRHWTLLLYLNDCGSGGATAFPLLRTKVAPSPRTALLWENLRLEQDVEGGRLVRNYYTLHDGQAPTGTEPKFAVNVWIRNEKYDHGL